jgi:hypothetical protein
VGALFVALVTLSGSLVIVAGSGAATGTSGLRARAAAIAASITSDNATLEEEGNHYLALSSSYESDLAQARASATHIGVLKHQVADDSGAIRSAAIAAYVGAGSGSSVGLLLIGTPDSTTTRNAYVEVAAGDLTTSIASLHNHEIGLEQSLTNEEQAAAAAKTARDETTTERSSALRTLDAEQHVLESVNTKIATLAEQEAAAAAARAEAAEQAALAAQVARAAAAAASSTTTPNGALKPIPLASGPPAPASILAASPDAAAPASLQEDFAAIRICESGDDYALNTGNGYYGAYQFSGSTWAGLGNSGLASQAAPGVQDAAAYRLYRARGWSSWPSCAVITGVL